MMSPSLRNSIPARLAGGLLLAATFPSASVKADVTDPVGYCAYVIPGGSNRLIGVPLTRYPTYEGQVVSVSPAGIVMPAAVLASYFGGANSAIVQVRTGTHAGLTFTATGYSGSTLLLDRSPVDLTAAGETIQIIPNHTLGTLFGENNSSGLQEGEEAGLADTVSIWNATNQSSRIFYYRSGNGWREAGNEAAGDQSAVGIPFPDALVIRRRATTPLTLTVVGAVPVPSDYRYFRVLPGRNLVSAPFSAASTVVDYELYMEGSPFSVNAGASAPEADTIRFSNFSTATDSEVIYYRAGEGWRMAGSGSDAGATPVELGQAMDFQRKGEEGIIRTRGIVIPMYLQTEQAAGTPASEEVALKEFHANPGGIQLTWPSKPGTTYRIQTRLPGNGAWQDLGTPVLANENPTTASRQVSGGGLIRIIRQ
jgi:uncharacterized protein (TIGR02597 family)